MYGFATIFGTCLGAVGLGRWLRPFLVGLCSLLALPPALMAARDGLMPWPWFPGQGNPTFQYWGEVCLETDIPEKYYTESEILERWADYIPEGAPTDSLLAFYLWADAHQYYHDRITPPTVGLITNEALRRVVDFGFFWASSTQSLVSVGMPYTGFTVARENIALFPAYLSSKYGLGFVGVDGLDPIGSAPSFGGDRNSVRYGIFTTNLFTTDPWPFQDYNEDVQDGPFVVRRQDVSGLDYFRGSYSHFIGRFRVVPTYYIFPHHPFYRGADSRGFPVSRQAAFNMLDPYYLPWYFQTPKGMLYFVSGQDNVKIKNVLKFHSSSTNQPGND